MPWRVFWFGTPDETGKQRPYTKAFRHNREAKAFQIEKLADLNRHGPRDHLEAVTLGLLLDEFAATRLVNVSHKKITEYTSHIRQLRAFFGDDRKVKDIRRQHAERFIASRKRTKGVKDGDHARNLPSWTLRGYVKTAGAIFQAGVEWGYLEANPFRVTGASNSPLRIRTSSKSWHHLTPGEFSRFMEQVPTTERRAAFWLMYGSGMRPGEVYNLTTDKVDLYRRRVYIENRPARDDLPPFTVKSETQTDADKSRVVPIPDEAIGDIAEAVKSSFRSGGFVTLTPERFAVVQRNWRLCRDGKPWGGVGKPKPWQNADMMHNLLRDAKRCVRQAGIGLSGQFDLKTFRKSYAQNLADAGVPLKTTAKFLGDDPRVVMTYYQRATDANEAAALGALNRILKQGKADAAKRNAG